MANTITRFGCAADGRKAIRCGSRFPSREGSGVGCFGQSPLFLSDLLADHEPILTPSHEESLHSRTQLDLTLLDLMAHVLRWPSLLKHKCSLGFVSRPSVRQCGLH